jgi:hypothetical protein
MEFAEPPQAVRIVTVNRGENPGSYGRRPAPPAVPSKPSLAAFPFPGLSQEVRVGAFMPSRAPGCRPLMPARLEMKGSPPHHRPSRRRNTSGARRATGPYGRASGIRSPPTPPRFRAGARRGTALALLERQRATHRRTRRLGPRAMVPATRGMGCTRHTGYTPSSLQVACRHLPPVCPATAGGQSPEVWKSGGE